VTLLGLTDSVFWVFFFEKHYKNNIGIFIRRNEVKEEASRPSSLKGYKKTP